MRIGVLSGKGGVGKTLISTNLARVIKNSYYIDCDIEEPNGYLFLRPSGLEEKIVTTRIPKVDNNLCDGCRTCIDICKFKALSYIGNELIIFPDLCHSCGGCILFCKNKALKEIERPIGKIIKGRYKDNTIYTGKLNIGEASGTSIINKLFEEVDGINETIIVDCPPGTDCNVIESVQLVDYCIIVAEANIFGLHNMKMAIELLELLKKPFAIVINKSFEEDNLISEYAVENNLEVIYSLAYDRKIGEVNSRGRLIVEEDSQIKKEFELLYSKIKESIKDETVTYS